MCIFAYACTTWTGKGRCIGFLKSLLLIWIVNNMEIQNNLSQPHSTFIKCHKHSSWLTGKLPALNAFSCPDLQRESKYSNSLSLLPLSLPFSPGNDIILPTGSLPPLTIIATSNYLLHQQPEITSQIFLSILLHTCATLISPKKPSWPALYLQNRSCLHPSPNSQYSWGFPHCLTLLRDRHVLS